MGGIDTEAADGGTSSLQEDEFAASLWKIDPALRAILDSGDKGLAKVVVVTEDVGALGRVVQRYDYKGLIGTKATPTGQSVPVSLELPASSLPKIASLSSVSAIYNYKTPVLDFIPKSEWAPLELPSEERVPWSLEVAKGRELELGDFGGLQAATPPPEPQDFASTEFFMDAPAAWANGFTGDGVFVAIDDLGVDFAHPDLQDTQARFDVSTVPAEVLAKKPYLAEYDGWPIAFDPVSMSAFLRGEGGLADPDVVGRFYGYVPTTTVLQANASGNFINFTRSSPLDTVLAFNDQPIFLDDLSPGFPDLFLTAQYRLPFQVAEGTVLLLAEVFMQPTAADVDAALFYDSNGDGDINLGELVSWEDTSTGANPEVFPPIRNPDTENDWIMVVLGYDTDDPGLVDITITQVSIIDQVTPYDVTGVTSLSDNYHVGLYPDSDLEATYFIPPAVLVVDENFAGVYDTVYVDLDNDFDFTDEKPGVVGDEILFTDIDGDGLADISGGMVYFISNATAVPEYTVLTAVGGETYANLAHGNISTPERITVELNGTVWRTTSVAGLLIITAAGGESEVQLDDTNLVASSVSLDGTEIEVLDELGLTVKDPTADTGFEVSNDDLLNMTIFRERQTDTDGDGEDDWFGPTLVKLASPADYTVDLPSGVVTFTAKLTNNPNPFEANMVGDEFRAFYNYTGVMNPETAFTVDYADGTITLTYPLKAGATVTADYEYYNWALDYVEGSLTFTHPLGPGDVISAAYQYGWVPIPYSDVLAERLGVDNFYAGNGDLVAFMGPYAGAHGTEVASQIVSQGNSLSGLTRGVAPDAKIIAILDTLAETVNSAYFAVEGYDGVPGTGDEANVLSNSWGYPTSVTGWEFDDRFYDWLATNYSKGNTSITFSAGNDGQGYGTVTSPSAPGVIMVGGAEHFFYRVVDLTRSYDSGPNPMGGDAADFPSRGPTATGQFGTDVVGAAEFVHASIPLNSLGPDFDGFSAVDFVSGTSFSSPAAAGVLALAYDAYKQRVGEFPDTYTIKAILMSGSKDIDNDVIVQGAGYINALGATNIANGLGGAFVTPYNWIPGDYRGDSYEVFARLMEPGDSEMQTFTLNNTASTAVDYDIAGETLAKFGEAQYTYNPSDLLQPAGRYGSGSLFYILNGTGIWDAYTNTLVQAINPALWNDADLLRITEAIPHSDYPGSFVLEVHRFTDGIVNSDWTGHTAEVKAVDISPDGTMMASAGADGKIFVVNLSTSEILWEFDHPGPVGLSGSFNTFDVKFAPNSTWLAASLGDFNISIWDVSSGSLVDTLTAPAEVIAIDLSPNGTWMVAGQWDSNVTIWDITTSTMVGIFNQTLVGPVNDVAFSPNGTWVASLDYGWWEVDVWNVTTLAIEDEFLTDPTDQLGFPMAVEFNPTNGDEIAYGWKYGWYLRSLGLPAGLPGAGYPDVAVYDVGTGTYTGWWANHGDVVTDISWSADGSMIASSSGLRPDLGGDDNSVKIWDATANDVMLENVRKFLDFVNKVDFAPSGTSFAAGDDEGAALVVNTAESALPGVYTVATALVDGFDNGIWYERNRQVTSFAQTGVESVRVSDPATRDPDGILIWTRDAASSAVDTTVTVTIEFYQKSTWNWLSLSSSTVSVPADGTATFDATMDVPSDAGVGSYEGAIYLGNDTWGDIVVPVMVNVLGKSPMIEFGGNLLTSDLYDNNRLYTWSGTDGDRRFYFFDVADTFVLRDGMKLLVDINMTFADSYGDIRHYQQTARGAEIVGTNDRYGPFVLEETDIGAPGLFKKSLDWQDQGNGLVKGLSAGPGLNLLEVQGAILDGSTFYETIEGRTGLMTFNPYPVEIYTNTLVGENDDALPLTVTSTLAWEANPDPFDPNYGKAMAVTVAGAESQTFEDLVVFQDDPDDPFTASYVKTMVLENIVSIVFHIEGQPADDLDLFVYFDSNGNGALDTSDERMGSSTTPTAIETVSLLLPQDGTYFILVHGWSVPAGSATFDLTIDTLVTGAAPVALAEIPSEVEPNEPATALLEWGLPTTQADGDVTAAFFVSPGNAPLSLSLLVSVTLHLDRVEPAFSDFTPAPGATLANNMPNILLSVSDTSQVDKDTLRILLDGVDITGTASVGIPFSGGGYFSGIVTYTPVTGLAEGSHLVEAEISDLAGNSAEASWAFTIDTSAPFLRITSPAEGLATSSSSVTVSGNTEAGAAVTIAEQSVSVNPQGAFSAIVTLNPGANAIEVTSTDSVGNSVSLTRIVTRDTTNPTISQLKSSAGLLTNRDSTLVSGLVNEKVSLAVGGTPTMVRSDGTFELSVNLAEGSNAIDVVAIDLAGNQASATLTITRDSSAPALTLHALPSEVSGATITVSGTVESGIAFVTVNGQPVAVSAGEYSTEVALSFGTNEIFVVATDAAGNSRTISASVSYVPTGVNVSAIGLILLPVIAVIALLLGLTLGQIGGARPPKREVTPPPERPRMPPEMPKEREEGGP